MAVVAAGPILILDTRIVDLQAEVVLKMFMAEL